MSKRVASSQFKGPKKASKRPRTGAKMRTSFPRTARAGELKGMDTLLTISGGNVLATTNTATSSFVLNLVPNGATSYQRVGKRIKMKSVRLMGNAALTTGPTATTLDQNGNILRMVVVYDKQPSGAQPIWSDIFGYTPQNGTEDSTVLSPLKYDNVDRFTVLRDRKICINPAAVIAGGTVNEMTSQQDFDEFIPLKGLESLFSGQSGTMTIADISSGALYVYFRAILNNSTTEWSISANSVARLRYLD